MTDPQKADHWRSLAELLGTLPKDDANAGQTSEEVSPIDSAQTEDRDESENSADDTPTIPMFSDVIPVFQSRDPGSAVDFDSRDSGPAARQPSPKHHSGSGSSGPSSKRSPESVSTNRSGPGRSGVSAASSGTSGPALGGPTRNSPTKSGPTKSGPAKSGPANSGPAKSGPAKSGPKKSHWGKLATELGLEAIIPIEPDEVDESTPVDPLPIAHSVQIDPEHAVIESEPEMARASFGGDLELPEHSEPSSIDWLEPAAPELESDEVVVSDVEDDFDRELEALNEGVAEPEAADEVREEDDDAFPKKRRRRRRRGRRRNEGERSEGERSEGERSEGERSAGESGESSRDHAKRPHDGRTGDARRGPPRVATVADIDDLDDDIPDAEPVDDSEPARKEASGPEDVRRPGEGRGRRGRGRRDRFRRGDRQAGRVEGTDAEEPRARDRDDLPELEADSDWRELPVARLDSDLAEELDVSDLDIASDEAEDTGSRRDPRGSRSSEDETVGRKRRRRRKRRGTSEKEPVRDRTPEETTPVDEFDAELDDDASDLDAGEESAHSAHRKIPTWDAAIGFIVTANMESRSRDPHGGRDGGRGRGRGGRR